MTTRRRRSADGQALPEFALVLPLVLIVLFSIIQLGFLLAGQNGMTNAAREAARYASTIPTPDTIVAGNCTSSGTNAYLVYDRLTKVNLPQYIPGFIGLNLIPAAPSSGCGAAALAGTGSGVGYCAAANQDGTGTYSVRVRVAIVYGHPLFIPIVGSILSSTNTWQLKAIEEMRVEGPDRPTAGSFVPC